MQEHICTHIDNFVSRETRLIDGEVVVLDRWPQRYIPIGEAYEELFVHPRTGILLANRARIRYQHAREGAREGRRNEKLAQRKVLSDTELLLRIEADWFSVTLAKCQLLRNPLMPFGHVGNVHEHVAVEQIPSAIQRTPLSPRKASTARRNAGAFGCDSK